MGIAGIIMYQSVEDTDLTSGEHLARELELFQAVEAGTAGDCLHLWEAVRPVVVVGRSTRPADYAGHVDLDACRADGVAVFRRSSGGGAVVLGPGCLNYAIAISLVSRPALVDVAGSFCAILGQIASSLDVAGVSIAGHRRSIVERPQGVGERAAPRAATNAPAPRNAPI